MLQKSQAWSSPKWCISENRDRFFSDHGRARLSARQSVQCVPVMARSLGTIRPEGTHKERSQKRIALALEVCTTAVTETLSAPPMIGMRARGLLVLDLKAAGALPSSQLSYGRGHFSRVAHHHAHPIMHAPCTLRITLANSSAKTV